MSKPPVFSKPWRARGDPSRSKHPIDCTGDERPNARPDPCHIEGETMRVKTIQRWAWVHKWTSLVCTVFLLMLCITGLPLIFKHEIDDLLHEEVPPMDAPAGTPLANLDDIV